MAEGAPSDAYIAPKQVMETLHSWNETKMKNKRDENNTLHGATKTGSISQQSMNVSHNHAHVLTINKTNNAVDMATVLTQLKYSLKERIHLKKERNEDTSELEKEYEGVLIKECNALMAILDKN